MISRVARLRFRREISRDRLVTDLCRAGVFTVNGKVDRGAATATSTCHVGRATLFAERLEPHVVDAEKEVEDLGLSGGQISRRIELLPRERRPRIGVVSQVVPSRQLLRSIGCSRGDSVTPGIRPRLAIGRPSISLMSPVKSIGVAPLM